REGREGGGAHRTARCARGDDAPRGSRVVARVSRQSSISCQKEPAGPSKGPAGFFAYDPAALIIAAIRSAATYVAVSLYVLVAAPVGMTLAILFGAKDFLYFLGHTGVRLALGLSGIRFRVAGLEQVPDRAVVFCANHQSNVDPPVLFEALHPRVHIL